MVSTNPLPLLVTEPLAGSSLPDTTLMGPDSEGWSRVHPILGASLIIIGDGGDIFLNLIVVVVEGSVAVMLKRSLTDLKV